jgi:hypothetical protein
VTCSHNTVLQYHGNDAIKLLTAMCLNKYALITRLSIACSSGVTTWSGPIAAAVCFVALRFIVTSVVTVSTEKYAGFVAS